MNKCLDWIIHILGYSIVLSIITLIFPNTVYIDYSHFGIWGIIVALIIFILNKLLKPLLVWLTLPITAITLGLFYPIINIIILKLTDIILFEHFEINNTLFIFIVSILISIMSWFMDNIIIKKILKVEKA